MRIHVDGVVFDAVGEKPSLALCLAIEKSIKVE